MHTNTVAICYIIIREKNRYLLVQKSIHGGRNTVWNFLRDDIHLGETLPEAAKRIAQKEVGLDIRLTGITKVLYHSSKNKNPDKSGGVSIAFAFYATGLNIPTKLFIGNDILTTKWVTKEELAATKLGGPQSAYIADRVLANEVYPLSLLGPEEV